MQFCNQIRASRSVRADCEMERAEAVAVSSILLRLKLKSA